MSRTVQNAALGLGCVASALVLASEIIWYPLIELAVQDTLAMLFAVVVGFWLGAIWPPRLALGVGNAAVIAGFAAIWAVFSVAASGPLSPILFFGAALSIALGYALIGGSLARGVLARGLRRA
jgi:hypothetical protein